MSLKSFSTHTKFIQESPLTGSRKEKQGSSHVFGLFFWAFGVTVVALVSGFD